MITFFTVKLRTQTCVAFEGFRKSKLISITDSVGNLLNSVGTIEQVLFGFFHT